MTRITVLGGTGYAGSAIAMEAVSRGHEVIAFSRNPPAEPIEAVTVVNGSALVTADLKRAVDGAEVIAVALAPSGELASHFVRVNAQIAQLARASGARLGVVGGAGTLLVTAQGPKVYETPEFPEQFKGFSRASDDVLQALRAEDATLDWFVLTPPRGFGHYAPGTATGRYQLGGDVVLDSGTEVPHISGADFAAAFVDEIGRPAHRRRRFTVAS